MANVLKTFEEYPAETLDGIWDCYYNNLRSIMACDGGNDNKQAHNGGKKRQISTGSAVAVGRERGELRTGELLAIVCWVCGGVGFEGCELLHLLL